jgi:glycosyltransferase involved in cell wall biosynthesis
MKSDHIQRADEAGSYPRIAHIVADLNGFGGTEATLLRYLRRSALPRKNQRVIVLKSIGVGATVGMQMVESGISVVALNQHSIRAGILGIRNLFRELRAHKPDVISAWLYAPSLLGAISALGLSKPPSQVWHIRSLPFSSLARKPARYMTQRGLAILSRLLHPHLVFNSRAAREAHAAIGFSYLGNRCTVIPNGIDAAHFAPNDLERSSIRTALGIAPDALVIGCIGRFAPEKGYSVMFKALAIVAMQLGPDAIKNLHFVAVGNGVRSDNPAFYRLVSKSKLPPTNLHLLGKRADVERILRAFDVFVLPSISESFPNSLIEAMATSLACVAANVGDCSEILGENRFVVPPGDSKALAERIVQLLQIDQLSIDQLSRKEIGKRNRKEVVQRFGISKMVNAFDAVFTDASRRPG